MVDRRSPRVATVQAVSVRVFVSWASNWLQVCHCIGCSHHSGIMNRELTRMLKLWGSIVNAFKASRRVQYP